MIVGHGDIASVLKDKDEYIFFASGVSNSSETKESEFQREIDLLVKQDKTKRLVYFGSLSIFYSPNTRYAKHKRDMEELVRKTFKKYTIVRLGNITWGNNPHTLINYFKNAKKNGKKIEIWDTYRYLINKKDFLQWMEMIPDWNCELNIPGQKLKVSQIVKKYVK
jgi:nucleoside-diphosphate-sugar epimerase